MTNFALEVRDLSVVYPNGHRALDRVSLAVPEDGTVGLVGSSGCGKTTLIRAVLGLLPGGCRISGSVIVAGRDVLGVDERARRKIRGRQIGYVAQDPFAACDPMRRVRHHVEEAWTAQGCTPPPSAVIDGLTDIGITGAAERVEQYPHQWSGGMLQRATTVAATAHHPVVTCADEPTSALDRESADVALRVLRRTCRALLLVSHDLSLVARHADSVVVLDNGRVIEQGPCSGVLATPAHDLTADLLEASASEPHRGIGSDAEPILRLSGVRRHYGAVDAVAGVDLALRPGHVTGIVGRSGSGKSTLLRLASGQERPDQGTVVFGDTSIWASTNRTRATLPRPGWVMPIFQNPVASLDQRWPLWRTITEPLTVNRRRMSRADRRQRARTALAEVGLDGVDVDRLPSTLSVGQCQRIALVRAVIAHPAVVVADEPTASLDVRTAAVVAGLLRKVADGGVAVLAVSHDEPRLASYADQVLRMNAGRIVR